MSLNAMKSDQHNSQITIDYNFKPFKMEVTCSDENELWDCYDFEYGCTIGDLLKDIPLLPQYQTQNHPNPESSVTPSTAYSINFSHMPKLILTDDDKKWDANATTAETEAVYERINKKLKDTVYIPFDLSMARIVLGAKPIHLYDLGIHFPANSQSGFSYNAFCQIDNTENIFYKRVRMMKTVEKYSADPDTYDMMESDQNAILSAVNVSSKCIITFWHDYNGDGTYELTGRHFSLTGLRRGYL